MSIHDPTIPELFRGASVFITGGSGFIGKALIEKLLRCCPDVAKIYVLLRDKKGQDPEKRLDSLTKQMLYDRLRTENPASFSKLVPIPGDLREQGLGMSSEHRQLIQDEVSFIFHSAATIRFNGPLEEAVLTNVRGTLEVVNLALGMTKLKVLLHVSTAYINFGCSEELLEKLCPPHGNWRTMLRLVEDDTQDQVLRMLTPKIIGSLPNTYTYSKSLAEHLINDFNDRLPMVIIRPSIVSSSYNEPVPGWIDNFNGPTGLMVGGGKGLLRTAYSDPNTVCDFVPVDLTINAIIVATWKRALESAPPPLPVYNCCRLTTSCTNQEVVNLGFKSLDHYPFEGCIWHPNTDLTTNKFVYFVQVILFHMLPAMLIDGLLMARGKKKILTKLQRRIYKANMMVSPFMFNSNPVDTSQLERLRTFIKPGDQTAFGYERVTDKNDYMKAVTLGAKLYLLKESLDNIPRVKLHMTRLQWIRRITNAFLLLLMLWLASLYFKIPDSVSTFIRQDSS